MGTNPLEDELAIRDLVARYADAVTRRDEKDWAATWARDGFWRVMGREASGRDDVVALWNELMRGIPFVVQIPATGTLRVDGDRATGRWTVTEHGKLASGAAILTIGLYDDGYRRERGGWCFERRHFRALYAGPPDLSAAPLAGAGAS